MNYYLQTFLMSFFFLPFASDITKGWRSISNTSGKILTLVSSTSLTVARSYLAPWAGPQMREYCCRRQLQVSGPGSCLEPSAEESHSAWWDPPPSCWNSCRPSPRLHWRSEIGYIRLTRGQTFLKICQLWSLFITVWREKQKCTT